MCRTVWRGLWIRILLFSNISRDYEPDNRLLTRRIEVQQVTPVGYQESPDVINWRKHCMICRRSGEATTAGLGAFGHKRLEDDGSNTV